MPVRCLQERGSDDDITQAVVRAALRAFDTGAATLLAGWNARKTSEQ